MTEDAMGAPAAHAVFGESEEFGRVMLPMYVGSMQVIGNRVIEAARREGFAGTLDQRLRAMGWWVESLYTAAQARALADAEREACAALCEELRDQATREPSSGYWEARDHAYGVCAFNIRARGQGVGNERS